MEALQAFQILDLRIGRILKAEPHEKARKPSYKLWIALGPLGVKQSSAQITELYRPEDLVGRLVVCAVGREEGAGSCAPGPQALRGRRVRPSRCQRPSRTTW